MEQTIQALKESLKTSMDNWQQAQQQLKTKEEMKNSLEIGLKHRTEELSGLKMKASTAKDRLNEKVAEAGLPILTSISKPNCQYRQSKNLKVKLNNSTEDSSYYQNRLLKFPENYKGWREQIQGTMKDKLAILKQQYETAFEKWNQSQNQRSQQKD